MRDETKQKCEHGDMSEEEKAKCFVSHAKQKVKEIMEGPHCGCLICRVATHVSDNAETLSIPDIIDIGKKVKALIEVRHNVDAIRTAALIEVKSPDENPRFVEDVYYDLADFVEQKLQYPHHATSIRILANAMRDMRKLQEHLENEEATFEGVLQARADAIERDAREEATGRN